MLHIKNLDIVYDKNPVVKRVNLSVNPGEIVGIVGESGSGKSTVIRSILNILPAGGNITGGSITFEGSELTSFSQKQMNTIRGNDISMIFQHTHLALDPLCTIDKAFYECIRVHRKVQPTEARDISKNLMADLGLEKPDRILSSYPFELSGGMAQRVAVAMALVNRPKLVLADEPTSALDVTVQKKLIDLLMRVREENHCGLLIVSHNFGVIAKMAHRVGVMVQGELVEWGLKDEVLYHPKHPYTKSLIGAIPRVQK